MSIVEVRKTKDANIKRRFTNIAKKLQTDEKGLDDALYRAGLKIETTAVKYYLSGPRPDHLDRQTGTLAASINTQRKGKWAVSVGTNVEYARIHEYGGTIEQTTGQVAAGGKVYDRKRVIHMPARPFLRTAARDEKEEIDQYLRAYIKNTLKGV